VHPLLRQQLAEVLRLDPGAELSATTLGPELSALMDRVSRSYAQFDAQTREVEQVLEFQRNQLPIGLLEWDQHWRLTFANAAAEALLGWTADELLGRIGLHRIIDPSEHINLAAHLRHFESGGSLNATLIHTRTRSGAALDCEWTLTRQVDQEGRPTRFTALLKDVSERIAIERALRVSEERYTLAVSAARDGIWDHDLLSGATWFSPRCYQILDQSTRQPWLTLDQWLGAVNPQDRARARRNLYQHITSGLPFFEDEWRMAGAEGREHWIHVRGAAIRDENGRALRLAGSMSDVTERKRHERQLLHASMVDALTGLANRRQLLDAITRRSRLGTEAGIGHFAVLFIDMDRFKDVNDRLGHAIGDRLLAAFGQRLAGLVRHGDIVARLGGDEFAVLMPTVQDGQEALRASQRLQEGLRAPFDLADQSLSALGSVGVACTDCCPNDPDELLRAADIAMYSAKARGHGGIALFTPAMYEVVRERVELINDLRSAIHRGELRLVFQPIVEVHSGQPSGFEALLRWTRDGADVSPAHFVPLADEAGMMGEIGEWVIGEAARWAARWASEVGPEFYISVNMSARELELTDLPIRILEALQRNRLRPEQFAIEVTETAMIHAPELSPRLAELRAAGHRVLMDDFGTGYASLQNLAQLEFDAIKIDRSFAQQSADGQSAFLEAIAHLAWRLNKQVIIEGVEDERMLAHLTVLGIDYVQGFAVARPMEAEAVLPWIRAAVHRPVKAVQRA
jgi:diguanylate cyclase (GGDEF)-like protein/PAS domain S-box-containing protein